MGANPPANLQLGDKSNVRGYWESQLVVQLNDRILRALGSDWHDWTAFEEDKLDPAVRAGFEVEIGQVLAAEYGAAPMILLKDPRMCRLAPLWLRSLDRAGLEPKIVIPVRNPLESALSLLERDKMPIEEGLLLWLRHVLDAERFTRGRSRCFVSFAALLDDWRATIGRISTSLQIDWPVDPDRAGEEVERFLSRDLQHQQSSDQELKLRADVFDWVISAYEAVAALSISTDSSEQQLAAIDRVYRAFDQATRIFGPVVGDRDARLAELVSRISAIEADLALRIGEAAGYREDLAAAQAKLRQSQLDLADRTAAAQAAARELEAARHDLAGTRSAFRRNGRKGGHPVSALALTIADGLRRVVKGDRGRAKGRGRREEEQSDLLRSSGLFDAAWYLETYPDVRLAGIDPVLHYLRHGAAEGRDPSRYFSTRDYQERYVDVAAAGINPLLHFLQFGIKEKRYFAPAGAAASKPDGQPGPALRDAGEAGLTGEHLKFTRPGVAHEDFDPAILEGVERDVKILAYYLPQFHAIPENDTFWGKGFTEWRQIARALPRFPGHYQPRIPSDLGFYDLTDVNVMRRQAALAKSAGIHGFAFYYYWFDGHRVLERPVESFLAAPDIDMPFMVIWANENWTRTWDGMNSEILLRQSYDPKDEPALLADLARHFKDPRHIRLGGRPLFVIYQPKHVPDARQTFERWRACWKRDFGLEPVIFMAQTFGLEDPLEFGLDGAIEFPPHNLQKLYPGRTVSDAFSPEFKGHAIRYDDVVAASLAKPEPSFPLIKTIFPSWDNDARRPMRGTTFQGSTPRKYERWLAELVRRARARPVLGESFVAINAWNEWAEGAYLEPDVHYGAAYLNATARALLPRAQRRIDQGRFRVLLVGHDAADHGAQRLLLSIGAVLTRCFGVAIQYLLLGDGPLRARYAAIGPCKVVDAADRSAVASALAELSAQGFSLALANTTISGKIVEPLHTAGFRIVSLVHELPGLIQRYKLDAAVSAIGRASDVVVFAGELVHDSFAQMSGGFAGRAVIRPQGLYRAEIAPDGGARMRIRGELGVPPGSRLVINVGYGDLRKGFDLFTQAAKEFSRRRPDTYFLWIGKLPPGAAGAGTKGDATAPDAGRVIAIGHREEVSPYYAAADLLFLSSREDPYPSVVLEAMAAGLPVVGFAGATGCEELIARHGAIVPAGDIGAAVAAIADALDLPAEGAAVAAAARVAEIRTNYDFKDYCFWLLQQADPSLRRVSVLVPNYNHQRYLPERMDSIFEQHYPVYEIVVLDDASPDDSVAVLRAAADRAERDILLLANETNSGSLARQWRKGLEHCGGDFVWLAESDDVADPEFLARAAETLELEEADFCFVDSWQIDGEGSRVGESYIPYVDDIAPGTFRADFAMPGAEFLRRFLAVKNVILNMSGVLWRRTALLQALDAASPEIETLRLAGDWRLYAAASLAGQKVTYLAQALNGHRRHDRGVTSSLDKQRHVDEVLQVQVLIAQAAPLDERATEAAARHLADIHRHLGLPARDDLMSVADVAACREAAAGLAVSPDVHPGDFIFRFLVSNRKFRDRRAAIDYYFKDGRRSAETLRDLLAVLGFENGRPGTLLEFASGYGCVSRHAAQVFPGTGWTACDIHLDAVNFIAKHLGVASRLSANVPESLALGGRFDVVFALSFFSHMPERTWGRWLKALHGLVREGGYLIFTTHGLASAKHFGDPQIPQSGIWFKPESEQKDLDVTEYGQTLVTPEFVARAAHEYLGAEIRLTRLGFWWEHQDLYVIGGAG